MKKYGFAMAVVIPLVVILVSPFVMAEQFLLGGKPLNLYGYITQDVSFSLKNDGHFDNEGDLRSALFNFFVEGDYAITNNLKFYLSSMLTVDWIYELKHGDNSWNKKEFNNLKSECAFKLAEFINKGELFLDVPKEKTVMINGKERYLRSVLIEELSQLKRDNIDKDEQKKKIISKEEMKANIGRSPDFLDNLIMRMLPEVKSVGIVNLSANGSFL